MSGGTLPIGAYAVALAGLEAMTPRRLRLLLDAADPELAWSVVTGRAPRSALALGPTAPLTLVLPGIGDRDLPGVAALPWDDWRAQARRCTPADAWARCTRLGLDVRVVGAPGYPDTLADDPSAPAVLFVAGDVDVGLAARRVAIVGTRNATLEGRDIAATLGEALAARGVVVVSGLAVGIDAAAHRGALSVPGARVLAVVGSGLDVVYPRSNRALWHEVSRRGAVLSEHPPGKPPFPAHFPLRNRIIAMLGEVVVVVESRVTGGSLITAERAAERGRTVLAVPGSTRNPAADGTNRLLRDGCAPALDVDDVLVALGLSTGERSSDTPARPPAADGWLVAHLGAPATLDELVQRSGRDLAAVALAVGEAEDAGIVVQDGPWIRLAGGRP